MIFNEFVLTSKSFIRTVTTVKPEWYVLSFQTGIQTSDTLWPSRLLECGGEYFNLSTFPKGEAKTALLRVWNKRMGKKFNDKSGPVEKPKKKKRKKKVKRDPTPGPAAAESFEPVSGPSTTYRTAYQ